MKVIALNGSPRKNFNTAKLLENALQGAGELGAETELIHLYDLDFKGCISCFSCKKKNGKNYGKCALSDGLKPILKKIEDSDALIIGSPIYYGAVSGVMRQFLERFMFQNMLYSNPPSSIFTRNLKLAFFYTMNINEEQFSNHILKSHLATNENALRMIFGNLSTYYSFDTNQLENYDNVDYTYFDIDKKIERSLKQFPIDCLKAKEIGISLVQ